MTQDVNNTKFKLKFQSERIHTVCIRLTLLPIVGIMSRKYAHFPNKGTVSPPAHLATSLSRSLAVAPTERCVGRMQQVECIGSSPVIIAHATTVFTAFPFPRTAEAPLHYCRRIQTQRPTPRTPCQPSQPSLAATAAPRSSWRASTATLRLHRFCWRRMYGSGWN